MIDLNLLSVRLVLAALLLSCFTRPAAAQESLSKPLEVLFAKGVDAQRAYQLREAETAFLEVLRQGGKVSFVHNNLGIVYQQRGAHPQAILQFREALRLQPSYPAPRFLLGASLMAVGRTAEAIGELEHALKLDPQQALGRLELIKAYERAGNLIAVVDQHRKLREAQPHEPEYAYQLGKAYMKLAEWAFQRMKELNPRSALLYQTLASQYRLQGRDELALRALQQAIAIDPRMPELHLNLAEIYLSQGKRNEARNALDLELAIMPESQAALRLKQKLESSR